jgi:uncharacterized protein
MEQNQVSAGNNEAQVYSVPWSVLDTWLGVVLLVLLSIGLLVVLLTGYRNAIRESAGLLFLELAYLLPVALILAWRRASWKHLGFGRFPLQTLGIGCGLLIAGYMIILVHNFILSIFGISTQGEQIVGVFNELKSPIWLFITGAIIAPIVEEIFFRGFLFQGFRQKYGWVAALFLSSFIFGAAHLDPVSFIPTFILGSVLAYVYHRSNSLWPGIFFHASINTFGLLVLYVATKFPGIIPS